MTRRVQFALALVVVLSVAAIFVLPAFDLMPTAMRAWRAAQLIALAIAAAAVALLNIQPDLLAFTPSQSPAEVINGRGLTVLVRPTYRFTAAQVWQTAGGRHSVPVGLDSGVRR